MTTANGKPASASPVSSFSGNLFFLKVGLAVAGAMVGFLLSWYGYDAGAKAQSASALNGIVLLFSVIPGVGYLITAGVVRLLKVDRTLMRQIQSDLEKRRSNYSELNEYQELKTSEHVRESLMNNWPNPFLLNSVQTPLSCAILATTTLLPRCRNTTGWRSGAR